MSVYGFNEDKSKNTLDASDLEYDNSSSGLSSTDVQSAIDEIASSSSSDVSSSTVTFTNSDVSLSNATAWVTPGTLSSGATLSNLFAKISKIARNVKYLYNMRDQDHIIIKQNYNTFFYNNGNIDIAAASGAGIMFLIPYRAKTVSITVSAINGTFQYGWGNTNATLPTVITAGTNRTTYVNSSSTGTFTLTRPNGNNNGYDVCYIGASTITRITKIAITEWETYL